jgi:hypothetical protein
MAPGRDDGRRGLCPRRTGVHDGRRTRPREPAPQRSPVERNVRRVGGGAARRSSLIDDRSPGRCAASADGRRRCYRPGLVNGRLGPRWPGARRRLRRLRGLPRNGRRRRRVRRSGDRRRGRRGGGRRVGRGRGRGRSRAPGSGAQLYRRGRRRVRGRRRSRIDGRRVDGRRRRSRCDGCRCRGSGSERGSGGGRGRRRLGRRRPGARREQTERVDVPLGLGRDANPEVDAGYGMLRVTARSHRPDRRSLRDRVALGHRDRTEMDERHRVPVGRDDRHATAVGRKRACEANRAGGRRANRRPFGPRDVDPAMLARRVGVAAERERAEHLTVCRP